LKALQNPECWGAVHANDKYVNKWIGRYFEMFEVTKVLESYY